MMKKQKNAGFSLVEVVLSMAILAIISIPLLAYFMDSMKYNTMMADKQHATTLAQEVLEDLKNQDVLLEGSGTAKTIPYLLGRGYVADASNNLGDADGTGNFIGGTVFFTVRQTRYMKSMMLWSLHNHRQQRIQKKFRKSVALMTNGICWHWKMHSMRKL